MFGYTIVQHSGFGYSGDPQFEKGLETRSIETNRQYNEIVKRGGLVFVDYSEADDFCMKAMYPPNTGLIPNAQGTFSAYRVDGLHLYIPVRAVVG